MATPNPFPLNIFTKQDGWEKLQLLQNISEEFKLPADEINKIVNGLNWLYENILGISSSPPIEPPDYADNTAMIANQANQTEKHIQYVIDARLSGEISNGDEVYDAYYEFLGATNGSLNDYRKLSDTEVNSLLTSNSWKQFEIKSIDENLSGTVGTGLINVEVDGNNKVTGFFIDKVYTSHLSDHKDRFDEESVGMSLKVFNKSRPLSSRIYKITEFTEVGLHYLIKVEARVDAQIYQGADILEIETDINNESSGSGPSSPVDIEPDDRHANITALIADQNNQLEGEFHKVTDASDDPTINSGWAIYEYNGGVVGDLSDYDLVAKEELNNSSGEFIRTLKSIFINSSSTIDIANAINTLPAFTINQFEDVVFVGGVNDLPNPLAMRLYNIVLRDLGSGSYGVGGTTTVLPANIWIIGERRFDSVFVENNATTQTVNLGDIGATAIDDAFDAQPAIVIQDQQDGYVLVNAISNGNAVKYLFTGVGGNYGVGSNTDTDVSDFLLIPNSETEEPAPTNTPDYQTLITTSGNVNFASSHEGLNKIIPFTQADSYTIAENDLPLNKIVTVDNRKSDSDLELLPSDVELVSFRGVRNHENKFLIPPNKMAFLLGVGSNVIRIEGCRNGYSGAVTTSSYGVLREGDVNVAVPVHGTGFSENMKKPVLTGNAALVSWVYVDATEITLYITATGAINDTITVTHDNGDITIDANAITILPAEFILLSEDFTGTTVNPAKGVITNPNAANLLISQNNKLLFKRITDPTIGSVSNFWETVSSYPKGAVSVLMNREIGYTRSAYVFAWRFNQGLDYISIQGTGLNNEVRLIIRAADVTEYNEVISMDTDKRFKITYAANNDIKFWYWSAPNWVQIGVTKNFDLTTVNETGVIRLGSNSNVADNVNDELSFDELRVTNADYVTEFPI